MTYTELIQSITEIVANDLVIKNNLTLEYQLNQNDFRLINIELYKENNQITTLSENDFINVLDDTETIELNVGGVFIRLIRLIY